MKNSSNVMHLLFILSDVSIQSYALTFRCILLHPVILLSKSPTIQREHDSFNSPLCLVSFLLSFQVKLWENMCRSKPDALQRDQERRLQKIATRFV